MGSWIWAWAWAWAWAWNLDLDLDLDFDRLLDSSKGDISMYSSLYYKGKGIIIEYGNRILRQSRDPLKRANK